MRQRELTHSLEPISETLSLETQNLTVELSLLPQDNSLSAALAQLNQLRVANITLDICKYGVAHNDYHKLINKYLIKIT